MNIDVNNFENYTVDEYRDNLLRLGAQFFSWQNSLLFAKSIR